MFPFQMFSSINVPLLHYIVCCVFCVSYIRMIHGLNASSLYLFFSLLWLRLTRPGIGG